jgi:hypothetical protein
LSRANRSVFVPLARQALPQPGPCIKRTRRHDASLTGTHPASHRFPYRQRRVGEACGREGAYDVHIAGNKKVNAGFEREH